MPMNRIAETRLKRLEILITKYGSIARLNVALGLDVTDSTLSQIRTKAPNSKTGKPRAMGDTLAAKIEDTLGLEHGWMDTPPSYAELLGEDNKTSKVMAMMERMPEYRKDQVMQVVAVLSQQATGTEGS